MPTTSTPDWRAIFEALQTGARRRALDEEAAARLHRQRGEQAARDRARVQAVGARFLEREIGQLGVQLRPLHEQELRVRSVGALVALDAEVRRHRVEPHVRRQQLALARVDRDQVTDGHAPLALHLAAERRDEADAARSGDVARRRRAHRRARPECR